MFRWNRCPKCNLSFSTDVETKVYCSEKCRKHSAKARSRARQPGWDPPVERTSTCPRCSAPFHTCTNTKVYCSETCRRLAEQSRGYQRRPKRPRRPHYCRWCKGVVVEKGKQYCSTECKRASRKNQPYVARDASCKSCGRTFVKRSAGHQFCGVSCRNSTYKPRKTKTLDHCLLCGTSLAGLVVAGKFSKPRFKFCSDGCANRYTSWKAAGMNPDEAAKVLRENDGTCDACKQPFEDGERTALDHCHSSGKARGLLHIGCNTALGHAKDDPVVIANLAEYAAKHAIAR